MRMILVFESMTLSVCALEMAGCMLARSSGVVISLMKSVLSIAAELSCNLKTSSLLMFDL